MNNYVCFFRGEDQLSKPGIYWWLPLYLEDAWSNENNWTAITWHPLNSYRQKSGIFVGPISPW